LLQRFLVLHKDFTNDAVNRLHFLKFIAKWESVPLPNHSLSPGHLFKEIRTWLSSRFGCGNWRDYSSRLKIEVFWGEVGGVGLEECLNDSFCCRGWSVWDVDGTPLLPFLHVTYSEIFSKFDQVRIFPKKSCEKSVESPPSKLWRPFLTNQFCQSFPHFICNFVGKCDSANGEWWQTVIEN